MEEKKRIMEILDAWYERYIRKCKYSKSEQARVIAYGQLDAIDNVRRDIRILLED